MCSFLFYDFCASIFISWWNFFVKISKKKLFYCAYDVILDFHTIIARIIMIEEGQYSASFQPMLYLVSEVDKGVDRDKDKASTGTKVIEQMSMASRCLCQGGSVRLQKRRWLSFLFECINCKWWRFLTRAFKDDGRVFLWYSSPPSSTKIFLSKCHWPGDQHGQIKFWKHRPTSEAPTDD